MLSSLEERAGRFAAFLDRHPASLVAAFTLVTIPVLVLAARATSFWYDELFTYYVVKGPILEMLQAGTDHHPPAYYLLERASAGIVGDPHLGFRLPSIVGFWLACVCLFLIVRRRTDALWGAIAGLSPFLLGALPYAVEARPYAMVLGFAALAVLAWQTVGASAARGWWYLVLAGALVVVVSSSYYASLILVPFGIGEVARSVRRRRVDPRTCAAFIAAGAVVLAHLPLITTGMAGFEPRNWASPHTTVTVNMYRTLTWFVGVPLVVFLLVTSVWLVSSARSDSRRWEGVLRADEVALYASLLALPFLNHAVSLVTYKITFRYVIATIIGFGILATHMAYRTAKGYAIVGTTLLAVVLALGAWQTGLTLGGRDRPALPALEEAGHADLPVVFAEGLQYFESWHYAPPELRRRMRFFSNGGMLRFLPYLGFSVAPTAAFEEMPPPFLFYATERENWMLHHLVADGVRPRLVATSGPDRVYLVEER